MSKFFINVAFPSITAKGHIYNKFDMEISEEMYNKKDTLGVPIIYNYLYKYTKELSKDKIIITMSPDPAIVASTIAGSAEKYMNITPLNNCDVGKYADAVKYSSSLKILSNCCSYVMGEHFNASSSSSSSFVEEGSDGTLLSSKKRGKNTVIIITKKTRSVFFSIKTFFFST
jgi:hypothetical protein